MRLWFHSCARRSERKDAFATPKLIPWYGLTCKVPLPGPAKRRCLLGFNCLGELYRYPADDANSLLPAPGYPLIGWDATAALYPHDA